jgi:hypothetical protein
MLTPCRQEGEEMEIAGTKFLAGWVARLRTRFLGPVVPAAHLPTHCKNYPDSEGAMAQWPIRINFSVPGF